MNMSKLHPDYYYDSVYEIPYRDLYAKNIRGLIFDLDSTLVTRDVPCPPEKLVSLMQRLKQMGFVISLLSNNTNKRLSKFNETLQVLFVHIALKPFTFRAKLAMRNMRTTPGTTALIGDQVFTDVLCGNSAKMTTILVKPLEGREYLTVKIKRVLERPVMRSFLRKKALEQNRETS
jgi:hypothetical protein